MSIVVFLNYYNIPAYLVCRKKKKSSKDTEIAKCFNRLSFHCKHMYITITAYLMPVSLHHYQQPMYIVLPSNIIMKNATFMELGMN